MSNEGKTNKILNDGNFDLSGVFQVQKNYLTSYLLRTKKTIQTKMK